MIFDLKDMIKGLLSIGVNVTGRRYELLKWRTSNDAKKYYNDKQNKEFYKQLKKGNLGVVDAIRKDKQKTIDDLKQKILRNLCLILIFFCSACTNIPKPLQEWDVNSLKEEERTFKIEEQTINVDGKFKNVHFDDDWYVVHNDFVKTYNENQDTLIETLELLNTKEKEYQRKQQLLVYGLIGCAIIVLLTLIMSIFKRGGKR